MDFKHRFSIYHHPMIMKIKNNKYTLYNATTEEEIKKVFESPKVSGDLAIPPAKTPIEIVLLQAKDNLIGFSKLVDKFGLEDMGIHLKFLISLAVLIVPIIIVFVYSNATISKKKAKSS